jgi:hypothetical protein
MDHERLREGTLKLLAVDPDKHRDSAARGPIFGEAYQRPKRHCQLCTASLAARVTPLAGNSQVRAL